MSGYPLNWRRFARGTSRVHI